MPTLDHADILNEMVDIFELACRLVSGAAEALDATGPADIETRQSAVARRVRNSRNADLRRKIVSRVELQPLRSQPRVARAKFIDDARRENMSLAEYALPRIVGPIARVSAGAGVSDAHRP
jgi:hypothetical protein